MLQRFYHCFRIPPPPPPGSMLKVWGGNPKIKNESSTLILGGEGGGEASLEGPESMQNLERTAPQLQRSGQTCQTSRWWELVMLKTCGGNLRIKNECSTLILRGEGGGHPRVFSAAPERPLQFPLTFRSLSAHFPLTFRFSFL